MLTVPISTPAYWLWYQPEDDLLLAKARRPMTQVQVTELAEMLLVTAKQYGCRRWLIDLRRDLFIDRDQLHLWLRMEFFPRTYAEMGVVLVGYVLNTHAFATIARTGYTDTEPYPITHIYRIRLCHQAAEARAWLLGQRQPTLPSLRSNATGPATNDGVRGSL